jgi:hypothetical protein
MAPTEIWSNLRTHILEKTHGFARGCARVMAVAIIVATYGLGHTVGVIGVTGVAMTATSTPAQAWRGRGWGAEAGAGEAAGAGAIGTPTLAKRRLSLLNLSSAV